MTRWGSAYGWDVVGRGPVGRLHAERGARGTVTLQRGEPGPGRVEWTFGRPGDARALGRAGTLVHLDFGDAGRFVVDAAAARVIVPDRAGRAEWEHRLLTSVLPTLLCERGDLVLHASACEVAPGRAVAFAGPSGAGKSTIVHALDGAGYPVLSDDGVAVDGLIAWPGPTGIRLGPQRNGKALVAPQAAGSEPLDLAGLVIVAPRASAEARVEPLGQAAATAAALGCAARIAGAETVLDQCVRLARTVPVVRLTARTGLDHVLDDALAAISSVVEPARVPAAT